MLPARHWLVASLLAAVVALIPGINRADEKDEAPAFAPTSIYETHTVEGWTVRVHPSLAADHQALFQDTLALLADQLRGVVRNVPAEAVARLRDVVIWVEYDERNHACMAYHPGEAWLRDHGMNPEKTRSVEIANAANFLSWCRDQPWMVFHELAHAYHHQFIEGGFDNAEIAAALECVRQAGTYEDVLHINGSTQKHYALTNPMEYFAEGSEALFGTNDFYPFVRAELGRHDPEGASLLRRLWGLEPASAAP